LKIIEARYGVDGINNPDVTPYLLERLHGNSYAELVGADLFHGFDPLPSNPNKSPRIIEGLMRPRSRLELGSHGSGIKGTNRAICSDPQSPQRCLVEVETVWQFSQ
jgi:hypothetical protein